MPANQRQVQAHLARLLAERSVNQMERQLAPKVTGRPTRTSGALRADSEAIENRWAALAATSAAREALLDEQTRKVAEQYAHNIENFIGTMKVPVGIAGPLRVNGLFAAGDFYVPLATTEAALVASYNRGALLLTEAGGCSAMLLNEGLSRAPGFAFATAMDAGKFVLWATEHFAEFVTVANATTRHGELADMRIALEGNHVYLVLEYRTGDAAGQNMVTIASEAVCHYIVTQSPMKPEHWFVETNASGDKKATAQSFLTVRGKKVTADVSIPAKLVQRRLHTTPERMVKYWTMSAMGSVMTGAIGVQGHYANGLAALYIACGQDAACVAESAIGMTRFEVRPDGALYASVTLPNLIVGTVGGGTALPTQRACLEIMGLYGDGKARALAEVAAGLLLAGELSIVGALASGEFTRAHQRLARGKRAKDGQQTQ